MSVCFLMNRRVGVGLDVMEGGEYPGGVRGGKIINIYCMRKYTFNYIVEKIKLKMNYCEVK